MRFTDNPFDVKRSARDAARVRREIGRLFGAVPTARIVLAPALLAPLRQLFSAAHVDRLILTSDEYYAARHFPELAVESVPAARLVARVAATKPGAVIASVVSWHGAALPVPALFAGIRRALGARAPLLVADYTHAGAIGFPPVASLGADIVGGDPEKWLLPPKHGSRLAFLWMRSAVMFRTAARLFSPCFLAIDGAVDSRSARWIDPAALSETAEWLAAAGLTRRALLERHQANLQMKRRLARRLGIPPGDDSSVLWTNRPIPTTLDRRLTRRGLVWRAADGHTRILCRSDP